MIIGKLKNRGIESNQKQNFGGCSSKQDRNMSEEGTEFKMLSLRWRFFKFPSHSTRFLWAQQSG
ncbi:Uncharacterized protein APZ42_034417 [Daphnia magna]|uniref:Uncharacterized protein n=1 Tax=Daphnia magna TaxID=35525 RepID=A0A164K686_9CRUS|nr:Uncharacterized protein APZ42_034417 [Daphnia magna]